MTVNNPKAKPSHGYRLLWGFILVVLLSVAGAALGFYLWGGDANKASKPKSTYKYSGLVAYELKASKPDAGMNFDVPREFLKISVDMKGQIVLEHNDIGHKAGQLNDAYIAAATTPVTPMPDGAFLQGMSRIMGDPSTAAYKSMSSSLGQFVRDRIEPTKTSVSIGNAKPFTSSHISANAWKFSISAAEKGGKNPVKGEGVYVIGKKAYYYFMLTAIASDWQVDQAMWQKIFSSLQVDQK